jgi:hypothetical protein
MFENMKQGDKIETEISPDILANCTMPHVQPVLVPPEADRLGRGIHAMADESAPSGKVEEQPAAAADIQNPLLASPFRARTALQESDVVCRHKLTVTPLHLLEPAGRPFL